MKVMSELIKNIIKSNSIFANNTIHTTIDGFFPALKGLANKLTSSNALKSSLGEFSERYAELVYKESHEKIVAFNIIDNKKVFLDAAEVYLLRKKRKDLVEGDFYDSSGTAFFTDTDNAIEKAFFEFIERQSLVYSFLRKWPGKKIDSHTRLSNLRSYSNTIFSTMFLNDISILKGVHVILFVGINRNSYNVGLGTAYDVNQAIKKSLEEGIGFQEFRISDEEIQNRQIFLEKIDSVLKNNDIPVSSYDSIFFNYLTPGFVFNRFKYLQETNSVLTDSETLVSSSLNKVIRIRNICKNWKLKPCISFLNSGINNNIRGDVIHISANGAYPHIFAPFLEPEKYKTSYLLDNSNEFPNKYKYLPFP